MRQILIIGLTAVTGFMLAACANDSPASQTFGPGGLSSGIRTLMDVTTGLDVTSGEVGTFNFAGQSFIVRETGSFDDVRFNFYNFQKQSVAFGNLYLLTREYLGIPGDLSSSTPGFVARSETTTADGVYTFGSSAVITGGQKYWVYTDKQGSFAGSFDTDIYADGDLYVTGFPAAPFRKAPASGRIVNGVFVPGPAGVFVDANFKLQARAR